MTSRLAAWSGVISTVVLLLLGAALQATVVSAQPPLQRATEEPIKPPYVFPTPIFIPTYPGDTPVPPKAPAGTPVVSGPASGERTYTVVAGDNPSRISMKVYGVASKWDVIMQANGITDPTKLKVGMVLKIPATDAAGQVLPTAAAVVATTAAPATPAPGIAQATSAPATPGTATPSGTPSPVPGATIGGSFLVDLAGTALNVLTGFLLVGSVGSGFLSYLVYRRTRRLAQMNVLAKRIRLR